MIRIHSQEKSSASSKKITQTPQNLPLIAVQNIDRAPSTKLANVSYSKLFAQKIQCVENRLPAAPTLNEKRHLYKTYAHYGNTPTDCHADLNALDAALLNTEIKHSRHIALLRNQLAALNLMAETLLTPDSRTALTPAQLAEVNLRENIIRALIASASFLPDILLCSERIKNTLSIRNTLIDELIQGALRRLAGASPSAETELRALLHAPPLSLHEKFERFITDSQTALMKPLHKELGKHIQIIKQSAAAARRFLNSPPAEPGLFPPVSTDTLYAIRAVAEYLETLIAQLRPSIQPDAENRKIQKKYHSWLSPHGIEPAVPAAGLVHTLHRGLNNTASALEKLHRHINRERLSPFPATALKSFLSLSYDDRIQCLMLKKMAMPIQDNADKLQRAAADLHSAIRTALPENGYPLFFPATPEAALRTELTLLTEETPHSTLLLAAEAARTVAQQVLNTSYPLHTPAPAYAKFSAVVQEYSDELRQSARLLKNAVRQTEINFRQKSILSAIHNAHKTAHDIKHILSNALESVSGVARNSGVPWLRKLDIDLHTHWQGITALSEKGRNNYILCGQGQQGMAPAAHIQYAVLPLLNEAEKLRGACRSLEMTLGSPANQDAAEKTADTIKNSSLAGIIQAEHTIHNMLSEKNKAVYLCCKSGMPDPVSLKNTLQIEARALLSTARRLQETAWLLSWNADDAAVRQSLVHIRGSLRSIKKRIKDAVETATGVRPHINSTEGMIAKDAAEWLTTLKEPPDGKTQNDMITALTDRLCEEFISQHDPEGALFRLRITLALRDAEQGTLIWPLTPQEHLNTVKTPRDYTLAWAEKRLTYSMLYNCLVHYTPAALFSLSRVKNTLVSPLRLINLLLTPVRMAVTRRAMQKVRPGSAAPAELIAEYTAREMYQAIFRTVSLLSPQLFKTVAATGITAYGLMQGGEYRRAFLTRAAARLPGDLFWVGGFAAWHQAVTVFHALRQQEVLPTEQSKRLQEILNLSAAHAENTPLPSQINSRATRGLVENTALTHERVFKHPTKRLIEESKYWKNSSAYDWLDWKHLDWVGLKNINPVEGEIHTVAGEKYIYLRGLFWKIIPLDEDHFSIEAANSDNDSIICPVIRVNNTWDLAKSKATNRENKVTDRLLDASKYWNDSSALRSIGLENTPEWNGEIFTVSGEKYIYLRELYWKIMPFSENNIIITAKTSGGKSLFCRATRTNDLWDFAESEITNNQNNEVTDRLLDASKNWNDSSAFTLKELKDTPKWNGKILTLSNREYIYLRGLCWGIVRFSKHHIFIMARTLADEPITFEVTRQNDLWDLPTPESIQNETKATNRLLKKSKEWMDFSGIKWVGLKETPPCDGELFTVSSQKYIYLRNIYWKFMPLSENTAFILAKSQDNRIITCKIMYVNNSWDLAESEIKNNQNKFITDFIETSPHEGEASAMKVEKKWELDKVKSLNPQDKVTDRLIEASKHWKNPSTLELVEAQDVSATEGGIHSIYGKKYIYLQGVPWEIFQTSEDNIFIITENDDHKIITHEAKRINNRWDLDESEITKIQSADITQTQLDKNLTSIKLYYDRNELKKHNVDETSLRWWLNTEWKNRESLIPALSNQNFDGNIILHGDKKYLTIYSHTWEYDYKDSTTQGILKDRFGNKINIININGKWYLNGWEQQRKYLYSTINGLSTLTERNKIKIDDILQTIKNNAEDDQLEDAVKTTYATLSASEKNEIKIDDILQKIYADNPEILPEDAIQTVDTALSMLLFQNIENKQYINDILEIKYLLMLTMRGTIDQIIDIRQMEILKQLGVSFDLEALKENLYHLYSTKIDIKNYNIALKEHYFPPQTLTFDKNDAYYKAISYCDKLITQSTHKNNHAIFNEVLFFLTKRELILSNQDTITEEEREELYWLNIAKYHLYTTSQYLPLYDSIIDYIDKTHFNTDKSILSVLNKSKIDAVKMYYLVQKNLNKKDIHLNDDEALNEHSNIVMLNNEASKYLETVTAILFYRVYHSEEEFTAFDFIKAKLYYKQQMEQFIKKIYTFDTKAPPNFISNEDFRPSKDFSSQREYTRQFNDYIDKGSSEYESTLLTSLILDQFDISLENLSLPPKRWFTLKFTSYDYTDRKVGYGVYGLHYHNAKQWPEKVNVIELYHGDYITISEINGNMKINSFKKEEYLSFMKANPKLDNYLFGGKSSEFITRIVGPLPPPQTRSSTLGGTLKFGEEKKPPDLLKKAVQQSLHSSLNVAAEYQKTALQTRSTTQKTLEFLVPFYKECYDHLTDSHYTVNKTRLLIDFIVVCSSLENFGLNPKTLTKAVASNFMKRFVEGQTSGLSRTALEDIMFRHFPKTNTLVTSPFIREAPTEIISPVSSQDLVTTMVRPKYNIIEKSKFPARAQVQHNIPLRKYGDFGRYKGIYTIASEKTEQEANYFIKNGDGIYPVRWDKNEYVWKLVELERPMGQRYGMPIHYVSENKWEYHTRALRLRNDGINTEEIIAKTEESASYFNEKNNSTKLDGKQQNKNIFTSKILLTDPAATVELTKSLEKARNTAFDIINNAKKVLNDKYFASRKRELIQIFTTRNNDENFLILLNRLKTALKDLNTLRDIKWVDIKDSDLIAQISPYDRSTNGNKYLAINYSAYNKNKTLIFTENTPVSAAVKEHYANDNFARVLIHEFTHANEIAKSNDIAGYIELLKLNGKHDVTKLLLKAKLGLSEARNNADSLTEIIMTLAKTHSSPLFLDDFLEAYQKWEIIIEKRMNELTKKVKAIVAVRTQLNWESTIISEIQKLKEEYNLEMCNQLISEINENNKIFLDLTLQ